METGFARGRLLIKDIGHLVGFETAPSGPLKGADMRQLPVMEDAWLAIEDGRVIDGGAMAEFPGITDWNGLEVVEASAGWSAFVGGQPRTVMRPPGEFVDRIGA